MLYSKYTPREESGLVNIFVALVLVFFTSCILGWIYNLNALIPIVYFNILFTVGLGFAIAFSVQILGKITKLKKRKTRVYIAIFASVVAYYASWIAFILFMVLDYFPTISEFFSYFIYPNYFFNIIADLNRQGTWGFVLIRDANVNGIPLTIVWIVEAFIIFFISIGYTYKFPQNPFSDKKNKWYNKLSLNFEFAALSSEKTFMEDLKENGIDYLLTMERGLSYKYAKVNLFFLEGEDTQYLCVDNIFIEVRNNSKKHITSMVKAINISNDEAKKLIDKFGIKKEFFLDF